MERSGVLLTAIAALLLLTGCDRIPTDPEGTLDTVRGGTMRVGVTIHDPWVVDEGDGYGGVEVELIEAFAETLDADVEYFEGSEEELFAALAVQELDVAIGGFSAKNAHVAESGMTHPYFTTALVVAVPDDEDVPDDIAGREVAVESGTEAAGLLRKTDAVVVEVESIEDATGAVAVDDYLLDDLGVLDTGVRLGETDHVMAVPTGENDFMTTLERFLLARHDLVEELLEEASP